LNVKNYGLNIQGHMVHIIEVSLFTNCVQKPLGTNGAKEDLQLCAVFMLLYNCINFISFDLRSLVLSVNQCKAVVVRLFTLQTT